MPCNNFGLSFFRKYTLTISSNSNHPPFRLKIGKIPNVLSDTEIIFIESLAISLNIFCRNGQTRQAPHTKSQNKTFFPFSHLFAPLTVPPVRLVFAIHGCVEELIHSLHSSR